MNQTLLPPPFKKKKNFWRRIYEKKLSAEARNVEKQFMSQSNYKEGLGNREGKSWARSEKEVLFAEEA